MRQIGALPHSRQHLFIGSRRLSPPHRKLCSCTAPQRLPARLRRLFLLSCLHTACSLHLAGGSALRTLLKSFWFVLREDGSHRVLLRATALPPAPRRCCASLPAASRNRSAARFGFICVVLLLGHLLCCCTSRTSSCILRNAPAPSYLTSLLASFALFCAVRVLRIKEIFRVVCHQTRMVLYSGQYGVKQSSA